MSEGMEYEVAHVGCPRCKPDEQGNVTMLVWGQSLFKGNMLFCPECAWEMPQSEMPSGIFDPEYGTNIEWLNAFIEDIAAKYQKGES